ncbi:MAG: 4-hydroxy-tetrahydrodipicolinate reductase [Alphaproteobacteria bacterium]
MKIGIAGCAGRMGRLLLTASLQNPQFQLIGGTVRSGHPAAGKDIGFLLGCSDLGLKIVTDAAALFPHLDVFIDFSSPEASVHHSALAQEAGVALVIGTTGLNQAQEQKLKAAAQHIPLVYAANTSIGVTLLQALVRQAAAHLPVEWDIEIFEMHHRHKVDAPSGTALALGRAAAQGREVDHDRVAVLTRTGKTGLRPEGAIGYASLRGGDVVGDHTVIFAGPKERIELAHKAGGRDIYAEGALHAALWVCRQKPGLYSMHDVLGIQ